MDRFRIISRLGAGGFGEAFRAWDSQQGLPVVLKRPLAKHLQRLDILERFDLPRACRTQLQRWKYVPARYTYPLPAIL
jgi:serine/threonine protein kinase